MFTVVTTTAVLSNVPISLEWPRRARAAARVAARPAGRADRSGPRHLAPAVRASARGQRAGSRVVAADAGAPGRRSRSGCPSDETMRRDGQTPRIQTLVVLQPGYLPWLGFFDQLRRADVFVYYDDVQYDKHGWRNRNRIKTQTGPQWLTVPVLHQRPWTAAHSGRRDRQRVQPWARKHVATLRQAYARAASCRAVPPRARRDALAARGSGWWIWTSRSWTSCRRWLGLARRIERSSQLGIPGERSERLLRICQHFGARTYLSGSAARCVPRHGALRAPRHSRRVAGLRAPGLSAAARRVRAVPVCDRFVAQLRRRVAVGARAH